MAKIGTAHIEIKPVLNEEALDVIVQRIEDAIAQGVERALGNHAVAVEELRSAMSALPQQLAASVRQGAERGRAGR